MKQKHVERVAFRALEKLAQAERDLLEERAAHRETIIALALVLGSMSKRRARRAYRQACAIIREDQS